MMDVEHIYILLGGAGNQILGADMHHLADAVVRGFEARVNNPPREGFSQQALLARLEILRGARDTLADPELRADYNQALVEDEAGTLVLDVPWTKVKNSLLFSFSRNNSHVHMQQQTNNHKLLVQCTIT